MLHKDKLKKYNPYIFNLWYERTPLKWASLCDWDKILTSLEPMSAYSRAEKLLSHKTLLNGVFFLKKKKIRVMTCRPVITESDKNRFRNHYPLHIIHALRTTMWGIEDTYAQNKHGSKLCQGQFYCVVTFFFFLKKAHQLNFPKRTFLCDFSNQDTSCAQL